MKTNWKPRSDRTDATRSAESPAAFVFGHDVALEELECGRIALSPEGSPTAYLGYLGSQGGRPFLYHLCVGRDQEDGRRSQRFVQLDHGGLFLSDFLSDNQRYRIAEDRLLHLPSNPGDGFGVFSRSSRELDENLTRQLFGATQAELDEFLATFYSVVRRPVSDDYFPKECCTTFSRSSNNWCDLTHQFIPEGFPFIRFGETMYFGGHVSLYGFYRQMAFLCQHYQVRTEIKGEGFFRLLVDRGAKPDTIMRLAKAGTSGVRPPLLDFAQLTALGGE